MQIDRNVIARINRRLAVECRVQGVPVERVHRSRAGWLRDAFGEFSMRKLDGTEVALDVDIRRLARDLGV